MNDLENYILSLGFKNLGYFNNRQCFSLDKKISITEHNGDYFICFKDQFPCYNNQFHTIEKLKKIIIKNLNKLNSKNNIQLQKIKDSIKFNNQILDKIKND